MTKEKTKQSFPERDYSKPAEQQGIFRKFDVRRVDGSDAPGGKHHGCRYFVIDMDHDAHAAAALRAYAESCAQSHPQLAADLRDEFGDKPKFLSLDLTGTQLKEALEFIAPDGTEEQMESEVTIADLPADKAPLDDDNTRMPGGLYMWITDYPEEGCVPLFDVPSKAKGQAK